MAQRTIYGFVNRVGYNGDARYYLTRKLRDRAMKVSRDRAIRSGHSPNAARADVYPVVRRNHRAEAA